MRKSMQWMLVAGGVALSSVGVSSMASGAEYPALTPNKNTYATNQPVRVTMTNRDGQVTTLEYRKPVQVVSYDEVSNSGLVPVSSQPVLTSPAREYDLPELSSLPQVRYTSQPVNQVQYQGVPLVQTGNMVQTGNTSRTVYANPQQPLVNCAPTTTYSAPNYSVPVSSATQTVLQPIVVPPYVPAPTIPAPATDVQVSKGIYGQAIIYRPGQPVRNALRYLTP